MDSKKIRTYPPIIVSFVVGLGFMAAAMTSISSTAQIRAEADSGQQVQSSPQSIRMAAAPTAANIIYPPTAEPWPTYESLIMSRDWDKEESQMMMKIAMAEAEGENVEGKALVMLVAINRVWSDEFPNSIEEVVFQPKQFSPVTEGGRYYTTEPNKECYEALELVQSGWDESYGALYFESCENSSWHSKNLEFLYQAGNHKFYR